MTMRDAWLDNLDRYTPHRRRWKVASGVCEMSSKIQDPEWRVRGRRVGGETLGRAEEGQSLMQKAAKAHGRRRCLANVRIAAGLSSLISNLKMT
jgi:hypothetical protein